MEFGSQRACCNIWMFGPSPQEMLAPAPKPPAAPLPVAVEGTGARSEEILGLRRLVVVNYSSFMFLASGSSVQGLKLQSSDRR